MGYLGRFLSIWALWKGKRAIAHDCDVVLGLGFLVHTGFILDMQLHDNMASFSDFYHYITALFVDNYSPVANASFRKK